MLRILTKLSHRHTQRHRHEPTRQRQIYIQTRTCTHAHTDTKGHTDTKKEVYVRAIMCVCRFAIRKRLRNNEEVVAPNFERGKHFREIREIYALSEFAHAREKKKKSKCAEFGGAVNNVLSETDGRTVVTRRKLATYTALLTVFVQFYFFGTFAI